MQIFKSRKLIIGLAIGLGVVLLAGIVTALFFLFRSPGGQEDTPAGKTESEAGEQTEDEDTKVWLFDFSGYEGDNLDPNGYLSIDVAEGANYTFSFDYCVVGESTKTSVINAAQAWGLGSNVEFPDGKLQGKGHYSVSFTADWPYLYPVFQSHIPMGAPKLYIWNLQLFKEGDERNMIGYVNLNHFKGDLAMQGLISLVDIDPDTLEGTMVEVPEDPVWKLDFTGYKGENQDPGAHISATVEPGTEYTFSFDYCVVGETTGITVINAAKDWGMGSNVGFPNNRLNGKGTYTYTFTADYQQLYPVFQCHIPRGAAELYIWNISLVKTGTQDNMFDELVLKSFGGDLAENGLITLEEVDPDTLVGTTIQTYREPMWLLDFSAYKGSELTPSAFLTIDVEKGAKYTFSFDYCVVGESTGTKIVNAAKEWQNASQITFPDNLLNGKGSYTYTFTADHTQVIPVFQSHIPYGAPKLYVWNIRMVKSGTDTNLLQSMNEKSMQGTLAEAGLTKVVDVDPDSLVGTEVTPPPSIPKDTIGGNTWLLDFAGYEGDSLDPNLLFTLDTEAGAKYTFSFDYCVVGESTGTKVVNAAQEWGQGSNVKFTDNQLNGKGTYTFTFTADHVNLIPVFQSHTPYGKPKLYIWNLKLVKAGAQTNLLADKTSELFRGELLTEGLVTKSDVDTDSLVGTEVTPPPEIPEDTIGGNTWLLDFAGYEGDNLDPNLLFTLDTEAGAKYTFSFDYCVVGESTGTKVVNAAQAWGQGSNVAFTDNNLTGKGTYTFEFTADHANLIPVFQTHTPYGKPELYIWNLKLVKAGTQTNLLADKTSELFRGELLTEGLVTKSDVDTGSLEGTEVTPPPEIPEDTIGGNTWLLDFAGYEGDNLDPNLLFTLDTEAGAKYTFSFDYCVVGESTGTKVVNAAQAWGQGSNVAFTDNNLTGKGTYTFTFTADHANLIPVFQTHTPYGKPELYIWNLKLVKDGAQTNLLADKTSELFRGDLLKAGLVTKSDVDTGTLEPSEGEEEDGSVPVWLFDFESYQGNEGNPNALTTISVEVGAKYTFSFDYCVVGATTGTTVINAKNAWNQGSNVEFTDNNLTGKGTYTFEFTADMNEVIPVFQTNTSKGTPKLYVWNLKLVKTGGSENLMADLTPEAMKGILKDESLITLTEMDPDTLEPSGELEPVEGEDVWLFDFGRYTGENLNPNASATISVEVGAEYTFSFEYYVEGSGSPSMVNAAKDWQSASQIAFPNNKLNGRDSYTFTFTADHTQVIPVFQTHTPNGTPKLYIWDLKLVKTDSGENLMAGLTPETFGGDMKGLVSVSKMDPSEFDKQDVWLFDFGRYTGENLNPNASATISVEVGAEYTFSFEYYVEGSGSPSVVNAAKDWQGASQIAFPDEKLNGRGAYTYTFTFTADHTQVIPVFQTYAPNGTPKLYIWDLKLVKTDSSENLMAGLTPETLGGDMKGLVSVSKMDPSEFDKQDVWLFDFESYTGENSSPNASATISVEVGAEYTFSFDYCVVGATTGTTVINAKNAWGQGSNVEFTDNNLTGKGSYTVTFTADMNQVIPVFQTSTAKGKPKLYVWNLKLVKTGGSENLMAGLTPETLGGDMKELVSVSRMDPSEL